MAEPAVDVDALMAEVRERIRRKRAQGIYREDFAAELTAAEVPGPGAGEGDRLASVAQLLGTDVPYDPRSRRPLIGPLVTFARRVLIGLLRWWLHEALARQDRINRLVLEELRRRDAETLGKVKALEEDIRRMLQAETGGELDWYHFAAYFRGTEEQVRALDAQFVPVFAGRRRVVDLGSGRGTFLQLLRDAGIGAYGVDLDPAMVRLSSERGLEVELGDALAHLKSLPTHSIDGVFAEHFAEHVAAGDLIELLKECRRALAPSAPLVMVTPNPKTLSVGAHTFWLDPSHRRPIPPELFLYYLEISGFERREVREFSPSGRRLSEDLPEGPARDNARLLNEMLFGGQDYAAIGYTPPE